MLRVLFLILLFLNLLEANKNIKIVYASSFSDIVQTEDSNYSKLATLLNKVRKESKNVIFLFGGDSLGSSSLSSLDKGSHIIDILNNLEPDAMAVNKKEFSFFEDELSLRSYEASFPFILSNVTDLLTKTNLDGINDSLIVKKGKIKFGIVSIINKDVIEEYALKRITIQDIKKAVKTQVKKLKQDGAEFIILLQGYLPNISDTFLKENIVDLAFSKDIHFDLLKHKTNYHQNNILLKKKDQVSIVNLQIKDEKINKINKEILSLNTFKKDEKIVQQILDYTNRLNSLLNQKVGVFKTAISTKRKDVRTKENKFANLLTDAIKAYVKADVALINGGTIRGEVNYKRNHTILRKDILKEIPYRNKVVLLEVTGEQILKALENGFSQIETLKGRFPHVSGMKIKFDTNKAINKRVIEVLINNQKLKKEKIYKLATSNYLAMGGDGYSIFINKKQLDVMSPKYRNISDVLIDYIQKKDKIHPKIEGRIININHEKK